MTRRVLCRAQKRLSGDGGTHIGGRRDGAIGEVWNSKKEKDEKQFKASVSDER